MGSATNSGSVTASVSQITARHTGAVTIAPSDTVQGIVIPMVSATTLLLDVCASRIGEDQLVILHLHHVLAALAKEIASARSQLP